MNVDENEKISIWLAGNTGLRSPTRILEGFKAFSQSPYVGKLHGSENEIGFMRFLNDKGIIKNEAGRDPSGSYARKWRLMFERYGFIYGQVGKGKGIEQDDLGKIDEITPFGRVFLHADTVPAMQECFLRSLSVEQYRVPNGSGLFSPFRWVLALMLELEKRTGTSEMSRIEFGLWGHTTNPGYDIDEVVDCILDLRGRRNLASAKRPFDRKEIESRGKHYDKKNANFLDYSDMNMRYLRISGVLQRKGRGLIIAPTKHVVAESLAKATSSDGDLLDELRKLTNGAPLPTDDISVAKTVLNDLERQMKSRGISYDIAGLPVSTAAEVNVARRRLEDTLVKTDEINYAKEQRGKWREISDYMSLLIRGGGRKEYDDDNAIEVPKEETPAYLEWVLWRALLAIDHLVNKPYEMRGFKLDSDFLPVTAAGGGRGDLYCEFEDYTILTEVTMSSSSRQEAMEGEPVRRHVSDALESSSKPVYGLFIAVKVDTNTVETFRHGVWYAKDDERQRLSIVPLTLEQFKLYFEHLFTSDEATPERLIDLINHCLSKRDLMEASAWKEYISGAVRCSIEYDEASGFRVGCPSGGMDDVSWNRFPYGISLGSRIRDVERDRIGYVVGTGEEYILVAFEGKVEPNIVPVGREFFDNGWYLVD